MQITRTQVREMFESGIKYPELAQQLSEQFNTVVTEQQVKSLFLQCGFDLKNRPRKVKPVNLFTIIEDEPTNKSADSTSEQPVEENNLSSEFATAAVTY